MKRIILAGGSGFLGQALAGHFSKAGYTITVLTRTPKQTHHGIREIPWDARTLGGWAHEINGAVAVINLTGRSVNCRYNERNRKLILESRVQSTRVIGKAIAQCKTPPVVWLNSSTATIYKHTFGPAWDESGEIGSTVEAEDEFSVEVAMAWEQAMNGAQTPGTQKAALRTAIVLGTGRNSVFPILRRLVRLGLGGKMGDGRQYVSWIHETDFCRAIEWLMTKDNVSGPINICAPNPVTNTEMMKTFREIQNMPIGLPATTWMLKAGALALQTETELLLKSRRVVPYRLVKSGFQFHFPHLREALKDLQLKPEG